jgi:hypothetical protein
MSRTAKAARARPQHPEDWRPDIRKGLSFRCRNDDRDNLEAAVGEGAAENVTEFLDEAMTVRLGYIRCTAGIHRAGGEEVPVRFGNLGGTSLDPWIAVAVRAVRSQDHRAHEPVTIGMDE